MDGFYEGADSLFVQAYDAFHNAYTAVSGDAAFYEDVARASAGPVLELACGTGRITLALTQAGLEITGADISAGMLSVAHDRARVLPDDARARLTLTEQDMTRLDLGRRFGFAFVPYHSFHHIPTIDLQRKALAAIRQHLDPGGRLVLDLFDPRFDLLMDGSGAGRKRAGLDDVTGRRYTAVVTEVGFDRLAQVRRETWRYAEVDATGKVLREATREMVLRWTYRWELHYLLASCGFVVEAEYSDFRRAAPAYGKELIVVARRDGS